MLPDRVSSLRINNELLVGFGDVEEKSLAAIIGKTDLHDIEVFLTGSQESLFEDAVIFTLFSKDPTQIFIFCSHAVVMRLGTGDDDSIFH
jgi:hypothetical protein